MDDRATRAPSGARELRTSASAKINLTLEVLARRADGFHDIRSVAVGVDLCDEVAVAAAAGLSITCHIAHLEGADNLAYRAAALLAGHCDIEPDVRIELTKHIPEGGGLGGGSSDAAATLRLCNELWSTGLDDPQLAALGAELGSDVPLFFHLPSVMMAGRGERVTSVSLRWRGWALLVFAGGVVPTGDVYQALTESDRAARPCGASDRVMAAESAAELSSLLGNQLEPAVFRVAPHVRIVFDQLSKWEVGRVCVSGAGSTLFVLFDDRQQAREVADRIEACGIAAGTCVVRAPSAPPPLKLQELQHGNFGSTHQVGGQSQRSIEGVLHHHV